MTPPAARSRSSTTSGAISDERRLGVSSIHDAIVAGLVTRPDPDRRRLLIAITDGIDNKSVTSHRALERVARRTDTVMHIVSVVPEAPPAFGDAGDVSSIPRPVRRAPDFVRDEPSQEERALFETLPALTGGVLHGPSHDSRFGARNINVVARIRDVIEEFRQSYVIQYRPRGVATGTWHDVVVRVKGIDPKGVRARAGYFDTAR